MYNSQWNEEFVNNSDPHCIVNVKFKYIYINKCYFTSYVGIAGYPQQTEVAQDAYRKSEEPKK